MSKPLTDKQKEANRVERARKKAENLEAEKLAKEEAERADAGQEGDGGDESPESNEPPKQAPKPAAKQTGTRFMSQYARYRCREVQFENNLAVVENKAVIERLKSDPKFGVEFWIDERKETPADAA